MTPTTGDPPATEQARINRSSRRTSRVYAYAVDFGEFDAFRWVLADDARAEFVMEALGRDNIDVDGADAIVERMSTRAPAPMVPRHAMVNHLVTLDSNGEPRPLPHVPRERQCLVRLRPRR